jgi:hypothetical protein
MEKEEWMNDIIRSLEGSSRARPDDALFNKIKQQINTVEGRIIPLTRLRAVAAAAVVLLLINVAMLSQYTQTVAGTQADLAADDSPYKVLSDYNVYDQ